MEEIQRIKGNLQIGVSRTDNIIEALENKEWNEPDTVEAAKEDIAMLTGLINGRADICLLIEIPNKHTSKELLHYYQQAEMGELARAMIIGSFATKVMGNLYLRLSKEKPNEAGRVVPVKLFTKKDEAVKWLLNQMNEKKEDL